jgi:hypothetical protein
LLAAAYANVRELAAFQEKDRAIAAVNAKDRVD